MSKLLTIAIPTYNRDYLLDKQLAWLALELNGFKQDCEIVVCDNCSSDKTVEILEKWRLAFGTEVSFTYHSNEESISKQANRVSSMRKANGDFVWALSDDDVVQDGTVAYLISKIREHADLSVILLNGSSKDSKDNKIVAERYFNGIADPSKPNGASEFLEACVGDGLAISSVVYRTKLVKRSFLTWPDSAKNVSSQAYWVAYCAARGSVIVRPSLHTEELTTAGSEDLEKKLKFKATFCAAPDVYLKLMKLGYPKSICLSLIFRNLRSNDSWRIFFASLRRWPIFTTRGFVYYLRDIMVATWLFLVKNGNQEVLDGLAGLG